MSPTSTARRSTPTLSLCLLACSLLALSACGTKPPEPEPEPLCPPPQIPAELQRKHRQTTDRLTREIARVNDLYRRALDAAPEPLPACVFTRGWVRVYDQATGAAPMPPAETAPGAAAPSTEAAALEQLDSGISQRDVLAHHVRYAEQCRNTADQLGALINAVGDQ